MPLMNELNVIDYVTPRAVKILTNMLGFTSKVTKQYNSLFGRAGAQIGDVANVTLPARFKSSDGPTLDVQPVRQEKRQIKIDKWFQISVPLTTAEMTLEVNDYEDLVLKPAMAQLANDVDFYIASKVSKQLYQSVGTPGTTPSTSQVLLDAQKMMTNYCCTLNDRHLVIDPSANYALVEGLKGLFNPSNIVSKQYVDAVVQPGLQFDTITCSQNVYRHKTGTRTNGTVSVTVTQEGATQVTLTGLGANTTVLQGDVFTVNGVFQVNPQNRQSVGNLQQFVVKESVQASAGGVATVTVEPPMFSQEETRATISALPQSGALVVFLGAGNTEYPQNIFYQPEAISLLTVDLDKPFNKESKSMEYGGVNIRVMKDHNIVTDQNIIRFDILAGADITRPEKAGRLWG